MRRLLLLAGLCLPLFACDDEATAPTATPPVLLETPPTEAAAGTPISVSVSVGAPNDVLEFEVQRGGGSVAAGTATSDAAGHVTAAWTLGVAPVDNTLIIRRQAAPTEAVTVTLRATLDAPYPAEAFADVAGFLEGEGHSGSTEDLTFTDDGLLMGAPEGVLHVAPDGTITRRTVDEGVSRVWGFAVDGDGVLWAVDADNDRLISIQPDGTVAEAINSDGDQPLSGPNYVAVDGAGRVYLTDPCLGEIIRLDPATGETAVHRFDLQTEGGPNGLALSPDGTRFYVATENTGLLCQHGDVAIQAPLAGVFTVALDDFEGEHEAVATELGLFGDGLAFDAEGNLYVVIDTESNLQLEESLIMVLPNGEGPAVKFLAAEEKVLFANVAFGEGDYGDTTLYIALLHIAPFTTNASRGLMRFDVGIPGLPLR